MSDVQNIKKRKKSAKIQHAKDAAQIELIQTLYEETVTSLHEALNENRRLLQENSILRQKIDELSHKVDEVSEDNFVKQDDSKIASLNEKDIEEPTKQISFNDELIQTDMVIVSTFSEHEAFQKSKFELQQNLYQVSKAQEQIDEQINEFIREKNMVSEKSKRIEKERQKIDDSRKELEEKIAIYEDKINKYNEMEKELERKSELLETKSLQIEKENEKLNSKIEDIAEEQRSISEKQSQLEELQRIAEREIKEAQELKLKVEEEQKQMKRNLESDRKNKEIESIEKVVGVEVSVQTDNEKDSASFEAIGMLTDDGENKVYSTIETEKEPLTICKKPISYDPSHLDETEKEEEEEERKSLQKKIERSEESPKHIAPFGELHANLQILSIFAVSAASVVRLSDFLTFIFEFISDSLLSFDTQTVNTSNTTHVQLSSDSSHISLFSLSDSSSQSISASTNSSLPIHSLATPTPQSTPFEDTSSNTSPHFNSAKTDHLSTLLQFFISLLESVQLSLNDSFEAVILPHSPSKSNAFITQLAATMDNIEAELVEVEKKEQQNCEKLTEISFDRHSILTEHSLDALKQLFTTRFDASTSNTPNMNQQLDSPASCNSLHSSTGNFSSDPSSSFTSSSQNQFIPFHNSLSSNTSFSSPTSSDEMSSNSQPQFCDNPSECINFFIKAFSEAIIDCLMQSRSVVSVVETVIEKWRVKSDRTKEEAEEESGRERMQIQIESPIEEQKSSVANTHESPERNEETSPFNTIERWPKETETISSKRENNQKTNRTNSNYCDAAANTENADKTTLIEEESQTEEVVQKVYKATEMENNKNSFDEEKVKTIKKLLDEFKETIRHILHSKKGSKLSNRKKKMQNSNFSFLGIVDEKQKMGEFEDGYKEERDGEEKEEEEEEFDDEDDDDEMKQIYKQLELERDFDFQNGCDEGDIPEDAKELVQQVHKLSLQSTSLLDIIEHIKDIIEKLAKEFHDGEEESDDFDEQNLIEPEGSSASLEDLSELSPQIVSHSSILRGLSLIISEFESSSNWRSEIENCNPHFTVKHKKMEENTESEEFKLEYEKEEEEEEVTTPIDSLEEYSFHINGITTPTAEMDKTEKESEAEAETEASDSKEADSSSERAVKAQELLKKIHEKDEIIEQKEEEIKHLKQVMQSLQRNHKRQVENFTKEKENFEKKVNLMKEALDAEKKKQEKINKQHMLQAEKVEKEKERIQSVIRELDERNKKQIANSKELQDTIEALQEEVRNEQKKREVLRQQKLATEKMAKEDLCLYFLIRQEQSALLEEREEELKQLKMQNDELSENLKHIRNECEEKQEIILQLEAKIKESEEMVEKELGNEREGLLGLADKRLEEVEEFKRAEEKAKKETELIRKECEKWKRENEKLKRDVERAMKLNDDKQKEVEKKIQEYEKLKGELETKENECKEWQKMCDAKNEDLKSKQKEYDMLKREGVWKEKMKGEREKDVERMKAEVEERKRECEEKQKEIESLEIELEQKEDEIRSLKGEIAEKEEEINKMKEECENYAEQKTKAEREKEAMMIECNQMQVKVEEFQQDVCEFAMMSEDLLSYSVVKQNELAELQQRNSQTEEELLKTSNELSLCIEKMDEMEQEVISVGDECEELRERTTAAIDKITLSMEKHKAENALSEEALKRAIEENSKLVDDANEKEQTIQSLQQTIQQMEEEMDSAQTTITDLNEALAESVKKNSLRSPFFE
ncbi:uncharacterized protein MONOS_4390 [Monocercomonoides exilis]|uniref:uncharacterized protein n=1 Tax=Monocercomonoides exilis TaxID=2049356 RepID=UPI0035595048|nr:hypothetical protein MONOS_4390 [Monocercomonoides exilis]